MSFWNFKDAVSQNASIPYGLSLQDISLLPSVSIVEVDDDLIDISTLLNQKPIFNPIWVSPMTTITNEKVALKGLECGFPVVLPAERGDINNLDIIKSLNLIRNEHYKNSLISVAFTPDTHSQRLIEYIENGVDFLVSDCAYAPSKKMLNLIDQLKEIDKSHLIIGNLLDIESAKPFIDKGVKSFKVGYGWGSICTSSLMTGIGRSQIDVILEFSRYRNNIDQSINFIVDGGLKFPGDILKALALGASGVMSGYFFAGNSEINIKLDNEDVMLYEGSYYQSLESSTDGYFNRPDFRVEGRSMKVTPKGSIEGIFSVLKRSTKLGMKLIGAKNIDELRNNSRICLNKIAPAGDIDTIYKSNFWFEK